MKRSYHITFFILALSSSLMIGCSKEEGAVDMAEGDYDREEGFHLWLSKEFPKGTVMDVKNTHTIYTLSRTDTKAMQELINIEHAQ